jgi:GNAT superfamily N-acetyltransferase
MTEIRPIHESEGETFLALLCDVFELDYYRAEGIFFTEPMFDLNRKWALFDGPEMVSILTTVPLEFGWGRAFGVAGVATTPKRRSEGLAGQLLDKVIEESAKRGETGALLFARELGVYAKHGFEAIDRVVRGNIIGVPEQKNPNVLEWSEIRELYDDWASRDQDRLRRDEKRWKYWKWNLRVCTGLADGYMCLEGNTMREAVVGSALPAWPVGPYTEWLGLTFMADQLGIKLEEPELDLYLMGYNIPRIPQMFLTDQF